MKKQSMVLPKLLFILILLMMVCGISGNSPWPRKEYINSFEKVSILRGILQRLYNNVVQTPIEQANYNVYARTIGNTSVILLKDNNSGAEQIIAKEPLTTLILPMFEKFMTLSPDERYLTYVTADDLGMRNTKLWLIDINTKNRDMLASFPNEFWVAPIIWSPDSRKIAFVKTTVQRTIELWTFDIFTQEQSLLVSNPIFQPKLFSIEALPTIKWASNSMAISFIDYISESGYKTEYIIKLIGEGDLLLTKSQLTGQEEKTLSMLASLPCGVSQFSQNSPEWKNDIMQTCSETIGASGCAVSSTAMVFKYYSVDTSPRSLNQCLGNSACPIYWGTAASSCSSNKVTWQGSPGFSWSTMESELNAGRPPILELGCPGYSHFVVVTAGSGSSYSGYTIIDPWDGVIKSLSTRSSCSLNGLRLYSGTPWCQGGPSCDATSVPSGYTKCADEGGTCSFSGTKSVYYGANSCFKVKSFSNGVVCNNDNFGDPAPGTGKACYIQQDTSSCPSLSGEVRLYDNTNCGGSYTTANNTGLWSLVSSFNDMAEAIAIPGGWSARLYLHDSETSPEACFGGTDSDLWNNTFGDGTTVANNATWMRVYNNSNCTGVTVPNAPSNLRQTGSTSSSVTIQWDDVANEDGYKIYRWNGSTMAYLASVGSNTTTFTDPGLLCGEIYGYDVTAYNGYGESGHSPFLNASVGSCPSLAPPSLNTPNDGAIIQRTDSVNLSWNSVSGAAEYYAEFWGGPSLNLNSGWMSNTSWSLGSQWGGVYQWRVKARNSAGESGWSEARTLTIELGPPSYLTASVVSPTQINLSWNSSADGPGNIDGYRIWRIWSAGSAAITVGNSTTSYNDSGLSCATAYMYHVVAYKGSLVSGSSNPIAVPPRDCPPPPPGDFNKSIPSNGATGQSNSLTLSWGSTSPVTKYEYCSDTSNDNSCSSWIDRGTYTNVPLSGLSYGTTYFWHVRAWNGSAGPTYANGSSTAFWNFTTQNSADSYEPDDTSAQAKTIGVGATQTHSIVPASDVDWIKFTISNESAIKLETSGATGFDTRMWLFNSNLKQLEYDDDDGTGYYSLIQRSCNVNSLAPGTYYVKIDEYGNDDEIPNYQVNLSVLGTCPCQTPEFPSIYSPADYFGTDDNTPAFDWESISSATQYQIQVDNQEDYSSPVIDSLVTNSAFTPSSALPDGVYYWRVRAKSNQNGCNVSGEWSDEYALIVSTAPPFYTFSSWTSSTPTIDGQINLTEWQGANTYDVRLPQPLVAKLSTSETQRPDLRLPEIKGFRKALPDLLEPLAVNWSAVTLYLKNDSNYLYLAIDNPNDTAFNINDQIGIYFDDNPLPPDGRWTNSSCGDSAGEGNFWVLPDLTKYREWISGPTTCPAIVPAPGLNGTLSHSSGHAQAETSINLMTSALRAQPGQAVSIHLFILDYDSYTFHGRWPLTGYFNDPSTYKLLFLAYPPGVEKRVYLPVVTR